MEEKDTQQKGLEREVFECNIKDKKRHNSATFQCL